MNKFILMSVLIVSAHSDAMNNSEQQKADEIAPMSQIEAEWRQSIEERYQRTFRKAFEEQAQENFEQERKRQFCYCVTQGKMDQVRAFLEAGMLPETKNAAGITALKLAENAGHQDVLRLLQCFLVGQPRDFLFY